MAESSDATKTEFLDGRVVLLKGNCLEVLKTLPDNSIDSCVCDPPYHLTSIVKRFGSANAAPAKGNEAFVRASRGFMGKQWDGGDIAFRPELWAEVLRVLKPGGHLIAFSGTRTYHRMACAIEDAGFEMRDMIQWLYGSGFPKSHDVAKGIDKAARGTPQGVADPQSPNHGKFKTGKEWTGTSQSFGAGASAWIDPSKKPKGKPVRRIRPGADQHKDGSWEKLEDRLYQPHDYEPQTDDARYWQGWGTALKPACEPIALARKPLIGSVVKNVLEHGTGAINIDGCRVDGIKDVPASPRRAPQGSAYGDLSNDDGLGGGWDKTVGRWPANVIHDGSDEVVSAFPDAGGQQADISTTAPSPKTSSVYGKMNREGEASADRRYTKEGSTNFAALPGARREDGGGSAARFFYTAKADAHDRLGSKHPTVKPLDLMQYLVRLVTPKGGTTLDPFAGTGTTGEAAWREGMKAILIEREEEYQEDIARRMDLADKPTKRSAVAATKNNLDNPEDLPLFSGTK